VKCAYINTYTAGLIIENPGIVHNGKIEQTFENLLLLPNHCDIITDT